MLTPEVQQMLSGAQAGNQLANGVAPSVRNSSGMPQVVDQTAPTIAAIVDQITSLSAFYRRQGDLESAQKSVKAQGLLQQITIDRQKKLVEKAGDSMQ